MTMCEKANKRMPTKWIFVILSLCLAAAALVSLIVGPVPVSPEALLAVLLAQFGVSAPQAAATPEQAAVIWHIRLPRTLVGILAGAALAVSGAVLQGIFGNPLADPGIIGVSGGASLGAVFAISLGLTSINLYYMPAFALIGAMLTVATTFILSMRNGRIHSVSLLLAGVAVSMFTWAVTSAILLFMNEHRFQEYLFWMVGGLEYRRWEHAELAAVPVLAGIFILCFLARHLNVLVLGEQEARAVGMPVMFFRLLLLGVATVTTAAAVCVSGSIGFVGLVAPHIMRILIGPEHRTLLPACALSGAAFLLACDTLGRLLMPPVEIRAGILTALIGAPYFLYLLRRAQKEGDLS